MNVTVIRNVAMRDGTGTPSDLPPTLKRRTGDARLDVVSVGKRFTLGKVWDGRLTAHVDNAIDALAPLVTPFTPPNILTVEPGPQKGDLGTRWDGIWDDLHTLKHEKDSLSTDELRKIRDRFATGVRGLSNGHPVRDCIDPVVWELDKVLANSRTADARDPMLPPRHRPLSISEVQRRNEASRVAARAAATSDGTQQPGLKTNVQEVLQRRFRERGQR